MNGVAFVRQKDHWLFRFSPEEWVFAGVGEAKKADEAYARGDARGGLATARRAAGMALNGVLIVEDEARASWGRTYMEHLTKLKDDPGAPSAVREAARVLVEEDAGGASKLLTLRRKSAPSPVVEAARDVVAHAYARVVRGTRRTANEEPS